ncbi:hypothetical protein NDU88_001962 [Pleurodeles waltl]|uniref:ribonuclease H n=1 Tax=Pleurodeles waltl TaxID=8319 RepID=A0AAV7LCW3_PLEWA|nr:hypothetical protein NDU88_001962 [Pleurodeles waltl]
MAMLDELVKAITQLQAEVVSSKELTTSLAERVSQLQDKVEKKEQSPTGVSWPATWAIPLVRKNSPLLYNWRNFVREFERVFDHRTVTQSADRELLDLRQGNQDLVSSLANFNRLVAKTSWPEEKQVVLFYKGLKEELKDILAQIDPQPTDCQELINLVLRLVHRLAERKGIRKKIEKYSWRVHDNRDSRTPKERTPEPMEIGTIRRPLTKDEKDLRRKNGQCLYCGRKGAILPNCRVYALSEHENQHLRKYLDKFLENGFIRPYKSPAASPLFFVPKANGELRTCIDYRGLNKVTIKNKYPLPLIPVLLEQVKKAKIYTKLDLRGAYHLVRMREGDEWKTAFKTRYGLFEYTVMPFGLCNAPAAFQFFLNDVLREYLDIFAIVYIDDILIYSDNENEHVQHVRKILAALRKHHLYCKLTKCEFHVTTVEFLGVILTPQGMAMAEKKVKAVSDWPTPKTVRDIQCFLGFANFYRRFINHFSQTVAPITKLLRKKEKFVCSPEADQAFSTLKEAFSTAPVLTHPDANQPFIVEADASDVAIGAVLSQRNKDTGQLHPVAYMSRKLNEAEQNYVIAEKELLVICDAFKEWRHHLLGAKYTITVYTDHRNLQFMSSARLLTPRQLRWMLFFAKFDFVVTFQPDKDNRKADTLSRQESTTLPAFQASRAIIAPDKVLCIIKTEDFFEEICNSFTVEKW